jgi:hypothetical protein
VKKSPYEYKSHRPRVKDRYDVVVGRWNASNVSCCSRSCVICIKVMLSICNKNQTIDRVYYFNDDGVFGYEFLVEMECNRFSKGSTKFFDMIQ